jgi:hypothetical protein
VLANESLVFSEDELLTMYEDILAHPKEISATPPTVPDKLGQVDEDIGIVRQVEQRLLRDFKERSPTEDSSFIAKLRKTTGPPIFEPAVIDDTLDLHHRVLRLAKARVDRLDVVQSSLATSRAPLVPIMLFSVKEYEALTRTCVCLLYLRLIND